MENNKITFLALIAGIIIIAVYLFYGSSNSPIVSAVGSSTLESSPDELTVYVGLETRNLSSKDAKSIHDEKKEKLISNLIGTGLNKDSLKFSSFNIYSEYDWSNGKQDFKNYVVSEQLVIEIENFSMLPEVLDSIITSDALVWNINFDLSEEKRSDLKSQALELAGKDARKKAESTAKGLGKRLGSIVSVETQDYYYYPYRAYEFAAESMDGGVALKDLNSQQIREVSINLDPKDISVSASLKVEYILSRF